MAASLVDTQMLLSFDTASNCVYQVQSNSGLGNRFWNDALPLLTATDTLTSVQVAAPGQRAFFRVLEFTTPAFWYDWIYYNQNPVLESWGLGATQDSYAHTDRPYEWYIDQATTGECAGNNCGPSSVTMAIKWFDPGSNLTAEDARNTYYRDGGWWYTSDVLNYLALHCVPHTTSYFTGTNQLMGLLSQGHLIILCITTACLTPNYTSEHRVGRFYGYASGHFLVLKGWRKVDEIVFFEVYDPNNWWAFYADQTPKGRNRHLPSHELANAIAHWWNYLIVVPPAAGGGGSPPSDWLLPVDPDHIQHMWGI